MLHNESVSAHTHILYCLIMHGGLLRNGVKGLKLRDFWSYMSIPRDLETSIRSLKRLLDGGYRERPHPYISGDSFKFLCDDELKESVWEIQLLKTQNNPQSNFLFFVSGLPNSNIAFRIVDWLENRKDLFFPNVSLVLHNGDYFPEFSRIERISDRFNCMYSVNWLGNTSNIVPIPIGLENEGYLRNGVVNDYLQMLPELPNRINRPIKLLSAFSLHTNSAERVQAMTFAEKVKGAVILDKPVTPKKYRELLSNSVYVLSPPGNGADCHRTWESLFLGATPIVKRKYWPFGHLDLDVEVIDEWQEVPGMNLDPKMTTSNFVQDFGKVEKWLTL